VRACASPRAIAAEIREELKAEIVATLPRTKGVPPKLAVVLVGERKDSETYVRMKTKACQEVGIQSDQRNLPEQVTEEKLLALIAELNADASVAGILVQLPLPKHINQDRSATVACASRSSRRADRREPHRVIGALNPEKDADGLHAVNLGRLVQQGQVAPVVPCTPLGCMELLKRSGVQLEGKRAAVLGRSILVGKPMALLLLSANATVTMCHSKTPDLPEVRRAPAAPCGSSRRGGRIRWQSALACPCY
jgi:5,10-methylene-tetrahydrofolate dehydrogenase/methenyl tetrahydrofolate cyclohydrolase